MMLIEWVLNHLPGLRLRRTVYKPQPAPEDDREYTLFEGETLRLRDLSVEPLEDVSRDPTLLANAFRIRVARRQEPADQAASLVMRRYNARGYQVSPTRLDPNLFTFLAYNSGELVGTVSIRLDSERGLAADGLYKSEINAIRLRESPVCEFTRLAIDVYAGSKQVLAGLFHTAYLFAHRVRGCQSAVIEVNPRHVLFYERALAFEKLGPVRMNPRVRAPAVLLRVRFQTIADALAKYAGRPELARSTRLLFPYGFSAKDEEGILGRLQDFNESSAEAYAKRETVVS